MSQDSRDMLQRRLKALIANRNHLAERISAELEFAEGLCALHPTRARAWNRHISRATDVVVGALDSKRLDRLPKAIRDAEEILSPIGKVARRYTVHCAGHAHIDMNWMWSWPETVSVTNDTFLTVLKLMEEFEDFCFTQSQASVYEIARRYFPDVFDQIRRRVGEGRWEIGAVHWVEGDKNLAGGESIARHLLYTRAYMREQFGLEPEDLPLDWEPDTFGHAATIPSILSRGAASRYYMCRGGAFDKPPVFWWKGPDGSRILVNLETTWYNGHIAPDNAMAMLRFCEKTGLQDWLNVYGVGDHGGGPTRRDLLRSRDMDSWPIFPNFRFATTKRYYEILEAHADELPELEGELNFEFTGCYSSQSRVKQAVRYGERHLLEAETSAALAHAALGRRYPSPALREAWIRTLFGHFHDILPGSGVAATREYQLGLFQETLATTQVVRTDALRALSREIDTSFAPASEAEALPPSHESVSFGGGAGRGTSMGDLSSAGHTQSGARPVVIFNPVAWGRREVVRATVWDAETDFATGGVGRKRFQVRSADGRVLPIQRLSDGDYWGHRFVELAFPVDVAAMGYGSWSVEEVPVDPETPADASLVTAQAGFRGGERQPSGAFALENEHLRVEFDPSSGGIVSLVDKASDVELARRDEPLGVLEYVLERARGMSSWIIGEPKRVVCPLELERFGAGQTGPYLASMVAEARVNDSRITITYTLAAGSSRVEIDISATWVERGGADVGTPSLRMRFPLALRGAKGRYEIPFGAIDRDLVDGEEVPAIRWADVTGRVGSRSAGCVVMNDCKHGHSLDSSTLRVTLLRSTYEPDPLPEVGEHSMRLAIMPHVGPVGVAGAIREAAGFNHPLQVVATDVHSGPLASEAMGLGVSAPTGVVVTSVKQTEDGRGFLVRLLETAGKACEARVEVGAELLGKVVEAQETDLLERSLETSTARASEEGFRVRMQAHGIVSVKLILERMRD
jgi:alpha-mannosidase